LAELQKLVKVAEAAPPPAPMARTDKKLGFEIERKFANLSPEEHRLNQQAIHEVVKKELQS
jgi:hypothetical protein